MGIVGLIPARGGSKGVPGKNIKPLDGKPLICWTIEAAQRAKYLDRVIVSTDCPEIAAVAAAAGAEVPFMRPAELAGDRTPDGPVMRHLLQWLGEKKGIQTSVLVYLRPTTPFKTPKIIDQCIHKLLASPEYTAIRTITKVEGVNHPYWMHRLVDNKLVSFVDGIDERRYIGRQSLPDCYRVNGVVDVLRPEQIAVDPLLYGANIGTVELSESVSVDIDTRFDFNLCEFIASRRLHEEVVL